MGPAGVTVVIIRDNLVKVDPQIPTVLKYKTHADSGSLYNTPPFQHHICGLVFEWVKKNGGVEAMQKIVRKSTDALWLVILNSKEQLEV